MNQNNKPASVLSAQIRLLVPEDWLQELNALAKSKFTTRLGLIRQYLRTQMDKDLSDLTNHFKQREAFKKTSAQVEDWFNQRKE